MTWPFENDTSVIVKKLAKRNVSSNRIFCFFNVLTIALAISLIVGISLFQQGSKISEQKILNQMQQATIGGLTAEQIEVLKKEPDLEDIVPYRRGGYPEATARLSEALKNPAFRQTLLDEYAAFWTAYSQDRSLMRFHFHKTQEIWNNLKDLSLPRREFSTAMTELPKTNQFITEDEINAALSGGSSFSGGKGRIYDFFREPHTPKEQTDFLKKEYGIGGHSHALSRATGSHEDHDGISIVIVF